jgi:probable phosphoglycerate mutase
VTEPEVQEAPAGAPAPDAAATDAAAAGTPNGPPKKLEPPTRVVLVRHAVTAQTGPMLSGRLPGIDLSERGVEQATTTASRLATVPVDAVYASPIERTTQTAQLIAKHHDLEVQALPGVIEADYGDWTGGKLVDLAKTPEWTVVQRTPSRARFPNGETILEMQTRTVVAIEDVIRRHAHRTVVIVSHADPIKAAIAHFTGMHLDLFQRLHVSPASVSVLEFHAHGATLVKCNDTGDLADLVPAPEAPAPGENDADDDTVAEAADG